MRTSPTTSVRHMHHQQSTCTKTDTATSAFGPTHVCSSFLDAAKIDHSECVEKLLLRRTQEREGRDEGEGYHEATMEATTTNIEERSEKTGKSALMYASELGHTNTLLTLLHGGAVVDALSTNGHSALMYAAGNGHLDCVKELLAMKADVHMKTHRGQITALMYASRHGHDDVVNSLLDNGAAIDARDVANKNALSYSSSYGTHPHTTQLLLNKSVCTCCPSLYIAAQQGHMRCIEIHLRDIGSDINRRNHTTGFTPLMAACEAENVDFSCIKALVKHGANVNQRDHFRRTPLHQIAKSGDTEIILFLLEHGADIKAKDNGGSTPLINAITFYRYKAVDILVKRGASVAICEECTDSLHMAVIKGHADCMRGLLDRGQNVNLFNYDNFNHKGKTPLMLSCELGHADCVKFLIRKGAKVNLKSRNAIKNTALIIAAEHGHLSCINTLLLNNANVNDMDNNQQTALIHACKRNHLRCVYTLLNNRGTALCVKDKYKKDAIMWCSIQHFEDCLRVLTTELEYLGCKKKHIEKMKLLFVEIDKRSCDQKQQESQRQEIAYLEKKKSKALSIVETLAKHTATMCMSMCTPDHDEGAANAGYEEFYLKLPSLKAMPLSTPPSPGVIVKNNKAINIAEVKEKSKKLIHLMYQKRSSPVHR